jgi:hypothetical protein
MRRAPRVSLARFAVGHLTLGAVCGLLLHVALTVGLVQYRRSLAWDWVTTVDARPYLDNRHYFAVRDSTRALVRRKYRGDTTTARARAYFAHMDSAYDPTYMLPNRHHRNTRLGTRYGYPDLW